VPDPGLDPGHRDPAVTRGGDDLPVILLVGDDDATRSPLLSAVDRRYGHDYDVTAEPSAADAMRRLEDLRDAGRPVAMIIADQWMPGETGASFLARSRRLHPTSQRLLVTDWADWSATARTNRGARRRPQPMGCPADGLAAPEVARDAHGFILTGEQRPDAADGLGLSSTMPGVFAAGDVRLNPVKRVAAAVGDGSTAIRQIHEYRVQRLQRSPVS
jgi:CheY-like chemotaxis protein